MLRGTGSNIYNASLAPRSRGSGTRSICSARTARSELEGVEIHNPDIGGLLPVYVKDPYEGFEVKAFPELSEAELDRYIDANVAAVREVAERAGGSTSRSPTTWSWARRSSPAPTRPLRGQDPRLAPSSTP